jgi:hypothetical protein
MIKKPDSFYVDAYELFISKFACAVSQIKSKGLEVDCNLEAGLVSVSAHKNIGRDGKIKVIGAQHKEGCWFINQHKIFGKMHPFILMIDGRFSFTRSIFDDIEYNFGFLSETIGGAFSQGFYYDPHYDSDWGGYHWSIAAGFDVARYLFNKHIGCEVSNDYGKLKYTIPDQLAGLLNE